MDDDDLHQNYSLLVNIPAEVLLRICGFLDLQSKMNLAFASKATYGLVMRTDNWGEVDLTTFGLCTHLTPECTVVSKCDSFCDRNWMVENLYQWMRNRVWNFINWYVEKQFVVRKLIFSFNFGSVNDEFADMVLSLVYRVEMHHQLSIFADWKFTRNKTLALYKNHNESTVEQNRIRIENFWHFLDVLRQRKAVLVQFTTTFDWSHTSIQNISTFTTITHLSLMRLYAMETIREESITLLLMSLPNLIYLSLDVFIDNENDSEAPYANPINQIDQESGEEFPFSKGVHRHKGLKVLDLTKCRNSFFSYILDMPQLSHIKLSRITGPKFTNFWDRLWKRCFEDSYKTLPSLQCITVDNRVITFDISDSIKTETIEIENRWTGNLKLFCQCYRHARNGAVGY